MFRTDCKKFYSLLRQKNTKEKSAPTKEEIENPWKEIFGKKIKHSEEACWIKNQCHQNANMEWSPVSEMEVAQVLRMMQNWKAPERDQMTNFWPKQLTATHTHLATLFNKLIKEGQIPD
jgi:hypothetical protein